VKHKWFGPFDWKGLRKGTISAPFLPDLTDSNNNNKAEGDDGADEMVVSDYCFELRSLSVLSPFVLSAPSLHGQRPFPVMVVVVED